MIIGSSITTPSSFYEPPPSEENEGSDKEVENSAAHDPNTDDIHLTTAFPTSSITSSSSIPVDSQNSLLPPVVIPPEITNEDTKVDDEASALEETSIDENVEIDSLTGKKGESEIKHDFTKIDVT